MLVAVFGPTGAGKSTAVSYSCARLHIAKIVADTTRSPRPSTDDRKSVSQAEFDARRCNDEYIWVNNLFGHCYGTPKSDVLLSLSANWPTHLIDLPISMLATVNSLSGHKATCLLLPRRVGLLEERLKLSGRTDRLEGAREQMLECRAAARSATVKRTGLMTFEFDAQDPVLDWIFNWLIELGARVTKKKPGLINAKNCSIPARLILIRKRNHYKTKLTRSRVLSRVWMTVKTNST